MRRIKQLFRRVLRLPGVPQSRHVAERAVAPYLRADLESIHETQLGLNHRLVHAEEQLRETEAAIARTADVVADLERYQPAVLNAIESTNGTARLLRRELDDRRLEFDRLGRRIDEFTDDLGRRLDVAEARTEAHGEHIGNLADRTASLAEHIGTLEARTGSLAEHIGTLGERTEAYSDHFEDIEERLGPAPDRIDELRRDMGPHIETLGWLLDRVEMIRAEMMNEIRYGRPTDAAAPAPEPKVINPDALDADDVRLNLGCGHIILDGFVNVDSRDLPGVDVVARVDDLPVEAGSVAEIFSAHVLEHFPEPELTRTLLPYWVTLLRPGGTFRAVVPDIPAMIDQYERGDIGFDELREVVYGGQEYEGDFHFTAFTTELLSKHLGDAGLVDVEIVEEGRVNGDCLEFEIVARRPA